ncbi:MAG: hypothetical protein Q8N47_09280 [Bryobacterales bacterium]|nr:hypothetical protein [Bryobacterales bacterium]
MTCAVLMLNGQRPLSPEFFATANSQVSFDGRRVLFAGKQRQGDPWQIWETSRAGGAPRRITKFDEDCVRPLYLPDDMLVYARKRAGAFQMESMPLSGGEPLRLTYAPGNYLPRQVLGDGRILFEGPAGLYTVYSDGSGVEAALRHADTARGTPLSHPSGLHGWPGARVLCLNAYESPISFAEGAIAAVRIYSLNAEGRTIRLGQAKVESDGSFYLHVPSERPIRIELADRGGRVLAGEKGWFWMRRGEQRVCVGCHAGPERAPENVVPMALLRSTVPAEIPAPEGER